MLLDTPIEPDLPGMLANLRREGTPKRVFNIEIRIDDEVVEAVNDRFELDARLNREDPFYRLRRDIGVYRFLGQEFLRCIVPDFLFPHPGADEGEWWAARTPMIRSWEEFERYPWPDPALADLSNYAWMDRNLPEDMSPFTPHTQTVFLNTTMLLGFDQMCMMMYDQPDLVAAVVQRVGEIHLRFTELLCQFDRVRAIFGADDWGFKTGLLMPPEWMTRHVIPWCRKAAAVAHDSGRLFLLHCCSCCTAAAISMPSCPP